MCCDAADDEGALDVLVSVFTGPPGPKPEPLLESTDAPVLILWGDTDALTPGNVRRSSSVHELLRCSHRWAVAPQYIDYFKTALSIFKVSAPAIQRDCPSMGAASGLGQADTTTFHGE